MSQEMKLNANLVARILEAERYPTRFEDFCADLFSDVDQVDFVKTSRTYDLGRDARGVQYRGDALPPYICCSVTGDVVEKALGDASRIFESVSPKRLLFCFTDRHFTEHKENKIRRGVLQLSTETRVDCYGAEQLADIIIKHPKAFQKSYAGELRDLLSALSAQNFNDEVELTGLRVALTTQLHDDAQERRRDLVRNLLLTALSDGQSLTTDKLARTVSAKLKLHRVIQVGWFQSELEALQGSELLKHDRNGYSITDAGREVLASRTEQGSISLLDGQQKISELIHELTGMPPSPVEFRQVWNVLKDSIATMFMAHGSRIVESIALIMGGESTLQQQSDLKEQIVKIGDRIGQLPGEGARIREVAQAIVDMFSERTSAAFGWLANICEAFLHLCTLGLEPTSQEQIEKHLTELDLILDTDIMLSLISEGERNNASVRTMIAGWRQVGGGLYVTEPALEEVGHHAWISSIDFERVGASLDKMSEEECAQLVLNVFVRGFLKRCRLVNEKCTPRRWQQYISAFKGSNGEDFDKVLELLEEDGCKLLSEAGCDSILASKIADELFNERKDRIGTNAAAIHDLRQKSNRDGRLLATLHRRREELKPHRRTAYIVSGGLRNGARALQKCANETEPVIYPAAVAWFLSLVPGVRLTANTLRTALFDVDLRIRVDPLERASLRYLQASDQYKLHFSRRGTLRQAVRTEIKKRAILAGIDAGELESRVVRGREEDAELTAQIIAEAVDQIARSQSENKIAHLEGEIQRLNQELGKRTKKRN